MQLGDVIWLTACFAQILEALNLDYDDRIEVLSSPFKDSLGDAILQFCDNERVQLLRNKPPRTVLWEN